MSYPEWTTEELAAKLADGEKVNLVDVREVEEWEEGHIQEARLIPLSELTERLDELKQDEPPIVLICRSGNRSGKASAYLASQGYNVVNIAGGMLDWSGDVVTGS
ncbi:rhodanese-like domain-containing protein [Paenibacillus sp. GCM10012307]|uniref:Rhodanese-like domain-containing protein n=1 Tax=Paenibacillus roseus TaxID=2798579 RepID=A0A934J927_9BACL|nr:rhodanese-like domain-containing protein [Paenibacillus roseus]MBJ6364069.1 rhodanese-like domain-containing protein [Paenibacillus roseus]